VERVLADLAQASGQHAEALARYQTLLQATPKDPLLLEQAAIAAISAGEIGEAEQLAARAIAAPGAGWRAWNARGVVADREGRWANADDAYRRAAELSPGRAEPLGNHGWSLLLRGEWQGALPLLERAAALAPKSHRIANNLQLARAALSADLPGRRVGESDEEWSARLNDAGVVAMRRGERARAVAAFARAIEARGSWYGRAANNLALLQPQP
jgi:Flp pilus assembly protein TadD